MTATLVPLGAPGAPGATGAPVGGRGGGRGAWGVLVAVQSAADSPLQTYYEGIGSQNQQPGGVTLVDRTGVAVAAWDRALIGRPVLDAARVTAVQDQDTSTWTTVAGDREVTWVGHPVNGGYALVFHQATDDLYGDLRTAQDQRNVALIAVLAVAVAALIGFQLWRQRAARREKARTLALLEHSQDLVLACDDAGVLVFVSPAIRPLLGVSAAEWEGRALTSVCHPDDVATVDDLLTAPGRPVPVDVRLLAADGEPRWFGIEASDVRGLDGLGSVLLTGHELGERKALQDELTYQATHDALTGAVEPRRAGRPHRCPRPRRPPPPAAGRAVPRPRRLQAGQRHDGPRGRRPRAPGRRAARRPGRRPRRHRVPVRRRRAGGAACPAPTSTRSDCWAISCSMPSAPHRRRSPHGEGRRQHRCRPGRPLRHRGLPRRARSAGPTRPCTRPSGPAAAGWPRPPTPHRADRAAWPALPPPPTGPRPSGFPAATTGGATVQPGGRARTRTPARRPRLGTGQPGANPGLREPNGRTGLRDPNARTGRVTRTPEPAAAPTP